MSHVPEMSVESAVEAVLEGGPATFPAALRAQRVSLTDDKIKVPHRGGYEHFERDAADGVAGAPDSSHVIFRWTGRTLIAE